MFEKAGAITNFGVLPRHFYFVNLAVLEFREIVAQDSQRLEARARIQDGLVFVSPLLKPLDVLIVGRLACQEVFLVIFLN